MVNKEICSTCRHKGVMSSLTSGIEGKYSKIFCAYSLNTGKTALKRAGNGTIDTRGYDSNNCLIYEKGRGARKGIVI